MKKIFILNSNLQYNNYIDALTASNIPIKIIFSKNYEDCQNCNLLLLTGGGDPDPSLYGEQNLFCTDIDNKRDELELKLINYFSENNFPILGICRGLQILNLAFGGSLQQNLQNNKIHSRCGSDFDKEHFVKIEKNSLLSQIYPKKIKVNSAHHQGIENLAPDFKISAISEDNIIEGIEHKFKKIHAVQWHPERMNIKDRKKIFAFFLSL